MADEVRDGVELKHLDAELFDGAGATKRELVDYLDAVADRILPELRDRPLTVLRVRPGQQPFMQKNLPTYAPDWIPTVTVWAQASQREVHYPLCHDRRTLLWFAGQRAVEFHPTVLDGEGHVTYLVLDLDPPEGAGFGDVVRAAHLVREALTATGLEAAATAAVKSAPGGGSRSRTSRSAWCSPTRSMLGWYSTARWLASHSSVRRSSHSG